jgi:hypothetical protein
MATKMNPGHEGRQYTMSVLFWENKTSPARTKSSPTTKTHFSGKKRWLYRGPMMKRKIKLPTATGRHMIDAIRAVRWVEISDQVTPWGDG